MQSDSNYSISTDHQAKRQSKFIIILTTFIDLGLGLLKILVGWFANSHALIADGIHSFSDLFTDVMVWFFNFIGSQEPDDDHPYGHGRFETIGTVILGAVLLAVAGALAYDSIIRLINIEVVEMPGWPALVAAAVSFAIKEWLFQITRRVGEKINSKLMIANAWHHRSDSLSSVIVFIGVAGALLGVPWLEMVAALGVSGMIAHIGWNLGHQSFQELVDTALSAEEVREIESAMKMVKGVTGIHSLRTRRMGNDVLLDIHIQVDSSISVSEGHHVGEWVTQQLITEFPHITDVIFHIDAEDDLELEEHNSPYPMLPLRTEVRASLDQAWNDILDDKWIRKIILHYLNERINVELFVDKKMLEDERHDASEFFDNLKQSSRHLDWINKISVWYG
jgi:cation diffusion facilitator family transporter